MTIDGPLQTGHLEMARLIRVTCVTGDACVRGDAVGCPGFLPPQAVMAMLNNKGRSHVDFMI